MATKFALLSLTIFVLLEAYNARHLHDVIVKGSFDEPPLFHGEAGAVIQMITGERELRLQQSPLLSSSYDQATYGGVNLPPALPKVAPSKGQEIYSRINSSPPPPPPKVAPSKGQATYVRVNPSPPPPPNAAPSTGQETYGRVNPSSPLLPNEVSSKGQETYRRVNSPPPPPKEMPPHTPRSKRDNSVEQTKYGRDDPTKPSNPNPTDSQGHGMYGRVNPSAPAAIKPADPTHPLLISDGGSACTGLSTHIK